MFTVFFIYIAIRERMTLYVGQSYLLLPLHYRIPPPNSACYLVYRRWICPFHSKK
jgi:hypothetical protein